MDNFWYFWYFIIHNWLYSRITWTIVHFIMPPCEFINPIVSFHFLFSTVWHPAPACLVSSLNSAWCLRMLLWVLRPAWRLGCRLSWSLMTIWTEALLRRPHWSWGPWRTSNQRCSACRPMTELHLRFLLRAENLQSTPAFYPPSSPFSLIKAM